MANTNLITEYIDQDYQIILGKPHIKGTRLSVESILRKMSEGATEADLLEMFPNLKTAHILACLEYAATLVSNEEFIANVQMIIADENIDSAIIKAIRAIPFDVLSIREDFPGITDHQVIELSKETNRIIITEDKDFGEWVFARKEISLSVIFLRYSNNDKALIIKTLITFLTDHENDLYGKFITLTPKKVRIHHLINNKE